MFLKTLITLSLMLSRKKGFEPLAFDFGNQRSTKLNYFLRRRYEFILFRN